MSVAGDRLSVGSQYRRAWRGVGCTVLAGVALGLSAAPADAGRAYGAMVPSTDLLTFELTDTGRQIKTAALRTELDCGRDRAIWYTQRFTVARRQPARSIRNRGFLIAQRASAGTLRYRIWARFGSARDYTEFTGSLTVSRLRSRSAQVRLVVRSQNHPAPAMPCAIRLSMRAQRAPGVLYVGAADDEEPVWVRRQDTDLPSVEWISGFGTACEPRGFMEGIHANVISMTTPTTFGSPRLDMELTYFGFRQTVQIAGQLNAGVATGTFRIVGSGGPDRADECDTKTRRWRAVST